MAGQPEEEVTRLALRRTAEMAAIFMIGDGMLGLFQPRRHVSLWRSDRAAADALVKPFAGRTGWRRVYGLVQIGGGLLLAARLDRVARDTSPL